MEKVLLVAAILLFLVLIWSYRSYIEAEKRFEKEAASYQESFTDAAIVLETISTNMSALHEHQSRLEDQLTIVETILGIHSEALNTKKLMELLEKD